MSGLDEGTPLFVQIAGRLAEEIADGGLAEGERVPSTVTGLTRRYRGQVVLDDVTLDVESGAITGLLGRNARARPR